LIQYIRFHSVTSEYVDEIYDNLDNQPNEEPRAAEIKTVVPKKELDTENGLVCYDVIKNGDSWTILEWAISRVKLEETLGARRHFGAAVAGTKLYLVGGRTKNSAQDQSNGCVIDLVSGESQPIAPLLWPRSDFILVPTRGYLCAVSGKSTHPERPYSQSMQWYNIQEDTWRWSSIGGQLNDEPSSGHPWDAVALPGPSRFFLTDLTEDVVKEYHRFNNQDYWGRYETPHLSDGVPRSVAVTDNNILVISGQVPVRDPESGVYNFHNNSWTRTTEPMSQARSELKKKHCQGYLMATFRDKVLVFDNEWAQTFDDDEGWNDITTSIKRFKVARPAGNWIQTL